MLDVLFVGPVYVGPAGIGGFVSGLGANVIVFEVGDVPIGKVEIHSRVMPG